MRRKMESRSRLGGASPVDIKLGEGGMADIEFLVQMAQLRYGGGDTAFRSGTVREILGSADLPAMNPAERIELQTNYSRYRTVETLLRITLEERNTLLPEGPRLDLLARCLGGSSGTQLRRELTEAMRTTRRKFLEISRRLTA